MRFPKLKSKAILSPMAGVTDVAFRALCSKYGAGMTCTEFVSSTGLVRGGKKTKQLLLVDPTEKPVAVQLFGSSFDDVINAAKEVEDTFDVIDINCGCPAWKVIKSGAGSEMLKKPEGIAKLISQLVDAVKKPVTLKIRSGIDEKHINAVEVAKLAEDAGAAAVTVHGRTQKQGYRGEADWELIKKVKESVEIPVIGNGDVFTPELFMQRIEESGVDAIMLARGVIGNPGIFKQITDFMKNGSYEEYGSYEKYAGREECNNYENIAKNKIGQFFEYLKYADKYDLPFPTIKMQAMNFTKGIYGSAKLRNKIALCGSVGKVLNLLEGY